MIQYLKFMLIVMQIIVMMKSRSPKCQSFIVINELCPVTSVFGSNTNKHRPQFVNMERYI